MIVLIDNYDSFSYNLYQLIGSLDPDIEVVRNDACTSEDIDAMHPDAIIVSPGPGRPENAGICADVIRKLGPRYPILGVCLGHQAICETLGGKITYAPQLMHGKQSVVKIDDTSVIFKGLPKEIPVARYHSLVADKNMIPESLQITAVDEKGEVMAVQHKTLPIYGVQFHPESIMTPQGREMIQNFMGGYDDDSRSS